MTAAWVKPMPVHILDHEIGELIIAERAERGIDKFDEIWDGVYVIPPIRDDEHQGMVAGLITFIGLALGWPSDHRVYAGINVSDREADWLHNLRIPDVAVYLANSSARNCKTHYCGGPCFAVEIMTPGDRTREKFDFYAKINTRELLLIDRDPWALELYSLRDGKLVLVSLATVHDAATITSGVVPVAFRLLAGEERPQIELRQTNGDLCRLI